MAINDNASKRPQNHHKINIKIVHMTCVLFFNLPEALQYLCVRGKKKSLFTEDCDICPSTSWQVHGRISHTQFVKKLV